ncbi:MAG: glutamate-5-semialdehyde dehydrogenase [Candidatus Omnitrophota bacterium]|jgi:glutamate-5-semialdehyde dehydrogenase
MTTEQNIKAMARKAKTAARVLALLSTAEKNKALKGMAKALLENRDRILAENQNDVSAAQEAQYPQAMIDRLTLNDKRIQGMVDCLNDTVALKDPTGEVMETFDRPNGLKIEKVRVPLGLIGIIYEARPNVASDCIGLCLKSGNAVILKGGKEAFFSNQAIFNVLKKSLGPTRIPADAIQMISSADRQAVQALLKCDDEVDLIIPRGGEGLIRFVAEHSLIPVIKHYKGVCHTYVSDRGDINMAQRICFNAKVQRPGVCNAMETMLVHKDIAGRFLPVILGALMKAGVEIRGCPLTRRIVKGVKAAREEDWSEEYLDLILAVKVVSSVGEAIGHINTYGSHHSDAIVTSDKKEARQFLQEVDSACVYTNASTRFTDGYEFGLGAEIGISTDKLHARGPMALRELTTYKYLIWGKGQIRT